MKQQAMSTERLIENAANEILLWPDKDIALLKNAIYASDQGWTPFSNERELFKNAARSFSHIAEQWKKDAKDYIEDAER